MSVMPSSALASVTVGSPLLGLGALGNDAFDFNACLADFKATFIDKVHEAAAAEALPR